MCDAQYGFLLSGGVDSSLTTSIACKLIRSGEVKHEGPIRTFCIGLETSPDLAAARKVAKFLDTEHHEFIYTVDEGLDALQEVVYYTETFNATTIRASTPMYLMARKIKSMGINMVVTGEGADEMFAGYLYFHKAPNKEELH